MILAVPILLKVDGLFIGILALLVALPDSRSRSMALHTLVISSFAFCVSGKIVIVRITVSTKLTTTSANVITVIRFFFMIDLSNYLKILN